MAQVLCILDSFKIFLVIFTTTFFASCLGAPTDSIPWWFHPCDTDVTSLTRLRHGRSTTEPPTAIRNQMNIFNIQLKSLKNKMDRLYNSNIKVSSKSRTKSNAKLKWLKMKKWTEEIRKASSHNQKLEKLHKYLQYYAGTLEVLRNLKIETELINFDQSERDSIYQNSSYQMRSLLCEVQTFLPNQNIKRIPLSEIKNIPQSLKTKNIEFTEGHLIDINFLKKMSSFVYRTQKLMFKSKVRKVKRNKSAVKNKKRT